MNDTLIQSFLSVAAEGSFCKAAEKIYISQPNLSRNIARLEKELDVQLFDRSGKHIALTEAGRIYEKTFQKMKQCFTEAKERVERLNTLEQGMIRIGYVNGWNIGTYMQPILREMRLEYPGIKISLEAYTLQELSARFQMGQLDLISDTLDLAKLQSGTMEMNPSVFAIEDVAEEVLSSVCANKPEFQFKLDCPESMQVCADRKLIYRVIYNFASNAVKFSGKKQEARIVIRKYQGSVRVEVIDYGIGIEKDKLPYIWNRFYQAKPNDREKCGMGVGLNIASEILRLHHAPFGADSTPNEGTCFWFMLEAYENET